MKFLIFLFALVCLYALVNAKGEITQQKESPLRKALRTRVTPAPVERTVVVDQERFVRGGPTKVRQNQQALQEPLVQRQQTVPQKSRRLKVVRITEASVDVTNNQDVSSDDEGPAEVAPASEDVNRRSDEVVNTVDVTQEKVRSGPTKVRQSQQTVSQKSRRLKVVRVTEAPADVSNNQDVSSDDEGPAEVAPASEDVNRRSDEVVRTVDVTQEKVRRGPNKVRQSQQTLQEPLVQRQKTVPQRPRKLNVVRVTEAPFDTRTVVKDVSTNEDVNSDEGSNVEPKPVVDEGSPLLVVQEQVEQGQDDTDEDLSSNVQNDLKELVKRPELPRKLDAPRETRRRFNVLLRTAEGFNEKAGYSISSRNVLGN